MMRTISVRASAGAGVALLLASLAIFWACGPAEGAVGEELRRLFADKALMRSGGQERLRLAEQFMRYAADESLRPHSRCVAYRFWLWRLSEDPSCWERAEEVWRHYRENLAGRSTSTNDDKLVVEKYIDFKCQCIQAGRQEDFADVEDAVQFYRSLLAEANARPGLAEVQLSKAYFTLGQPERAEQIIRECIEDAGDVSPEVYIWLATMLPERGNVDGAFTALGRAAKGMSAQQAEVFGWFITETYVKAHLDKPEALEVVLPWVLAHAHVAKSTLDILTERLLQEGELNKALAYSKLYYDVIPLEDMTDALEWVTKTLGGMEMDVTKLNDFLDLQKYGPHGPDGKPGGDDDIANPLKDVENPLPPQVRRHIKDRLSNELPQAGSIYDCLRNRGTLHLALGEYDQALRCYSSAYAAASVAQAREASGLVPRALKAMDGSLHRAGQHLAYQQYGSTGPDGKPDTADDTPPIVNEDDLPPLPPVLVQALETLAKAPGASPREYRERGYAYLALGDYRKGLMQMRIASTLAAADDAARKEAIADMAAAIKAYDGHFARANAFLDYCAYGAAGPDGRMGSADDVENPLTVVMEELAND
jgi:tetratricopeptide (TPR) repeat protein